MTRLQFTRYVEFAFLALFMAALGLLANEAYWLENTIHGDRLFWLSILVGCFAGFLPAAAFGFFHHELLSGLLSPLLRTLKFATIAATCVSVLFPGLASYVNRTVIVGAAHHLDVTISEKSLGGKRYTTPFLFFSHAEHNVERIQVDMEFYRGVAAGETIVLELARGYLGFDVVRSWRHA